MNATDKKPNGRHRQCWNCGADMGFIEHRFYDSMDTCGSIECTREGRNACAEEQQAAHDEVDDYFDGGW